MEFLEILKDNATDYSFVPSSGIRKPQKNLQTQLHLDLNFAQLKDFFQQYLLIFWRNKVFKPFHNVDLARTKHRNGPPIQPIPKPLLPSQRSNQATRIEQVCHLVRLFWCTSCLDGLPARTEAAAQPRWQRGHPPAAQPVGRGPRLHHALHLDTSARNKYSTICCSIPCVAQPLARLRHALKQGRYKLLHMYSA